MVTANRQAIQARQAEAKLQPSARDTMVKLSALTDILNAAHVLHQHGLITDAPHTFVKRYVEANPDINEALASLR